MYPRSTHGHEDAQLQADVMRFMAIVAFCLIAILVVVRNVDAPTQSVETTSRVDAPQAKTAPPPPADTVSPKPLEQPAILTFEAPEPELTPSADIAPTTRPSTQGALIETPTQTTDARQDVEPAIETAPEPSTAPALTLRFASDSDFLRLVTRGLVQVYAFSDTDFLTLDKTFTFSPGAAPPELHELDPKTIPAQLHQVLSAPAADWRWGVGLSASLRQQISGLARIHHTGALVIDKYQNVRHINSE